MNNKRKMKKKKEMLCQWGTGGSIGVAALGSLMIW
jgi:hypothetical protein